MSAADIVGILSSALHAAHKLYDIIQLIKNAPEDMDALQIEVGRVRSILAENIETSGSTRGGTNSSQRMQQLCYDLTEQARKWIEAANQFVEKATTLKEDGTRKVNRAKWPFKVSDAKKLAEDSKAFYLAVSAVYSIDTSAKVALIEPSIRAIGDRTISAVGEQITHAVEHKITHAVEHEIAPAMERLFAAQEARLTRIFTHHLTIVAHQQQNGHHQLFDELSPLRSNAETGHGPQARSLSLKRSNEGLASLASSRKPGPSATGHTNIQTISTSVMTQSPYTTSLLNPGLPPYFMLGPPKRPCPSNCRCRCHKQSNDYRPVPQIFRSWFGDIRIPERLMTPLSSAARPCDDLLCVQAKERLSVVKWYLPKWFARVHTEVALQSLPVHFVIQTPRVVESLDFIIKLSFEQLKVKLSIRELTINDVDPDGLTVIHQLAYMIVHDQRSDADEMMRYLIDAGAPQDWEYSGQTVTEYVTNMATYWYGDTSVASVHVRSFEYNVARPLLQEDMEDVWERIRAKQCWSNLHYLLANPPSPPAQLKADLAWILAQSDATSHLNARDHYGRTPLYQAIRSCPEAVDALLQAGANPHLIVASLGYAVQAFSWRAIGPLVRAGADVNERYSWSNGTTSAALHDVVRIESSRGPGARLPCALELVRHAGHLLDWDVKTERGRTPLWWADRRVKEYPDDEDLASIYKLYKTRRLPLGAQLIDRSRLGGEVEAAIHLESTSLVKAGLAGNVQAVGELIDAGAMVNERDASGRTLLHLVAMGLVPNGYAVALELVRHGVCGVDRKALTVDGETAEQLAKETLESLPTFEDELRKEALSILELLLHLYLPEGMDAVYPCMYADYCRACSVRPCSGYCSNGLRMPGYTLPGNVLVLCNKLNDEERNASQL